MKSVRLFLLVCLCVIGAACAAPHGWALESGASELEERPGCATARELLEALNRDEGGTVTVAGDIRWDLETPVEVTRPVTVELGDFGIFVPEEITFRVAGPVLFTGSGTSRPLRAGEGGFPFAGGVGGAAGGEHGTAVRAYSLNWEFPEISARGTGATAVDLLGDGPMELLGGWFRAEGSGSVAVRSERPVRLIFCRAEAEGAAVLSTGEVILDGSRVSPELPGARTIQRTAVPAHRIRENGLCAAMGTDRAGVEELWEDSLGGRAQFYAYDTAEREPAQLFSVPMAPVSFPETLSGDYEAACAPLAPEWFPLELAPFLVTIHAVGENQPFLMDAQDAGAGAYVRFFREITGADRLTLWVSEDGGKSWRGAEEYSGSAVLSTGAQVEGLEWNRTYLFQLAVEGGPMAGRSNVLEFPLYDDYHVNGGGSRDDDDRGDLGELPAGDFLVPPPESSPGESVSSPGPETWENLPPPSAEPRESAARPATGTGESAAEPSGGSGLAVQALPAPEPEKAAPALWPFLLGGALALAAGAAVLGLRSHRPGRHGKRRKGGGRP